MKTDPDQNPPSPAAPADGVMVPVEISPGKTAMMKVPRNKVGVFGLMKVSVGQDGAASLKWKTWHTRVALTKKLPAQLGLPCHVDTLRCLVNAGIVKGERVTPGLTLIDLDSLVTHLEASSGPQAREYWDEERTRAYSMAWKEVHLGQTTRGMKQPWHTERSRQSSVGSRQEKAGPLELPPLPAPPVTVQRAVPPVNQPELF